MDRFKTRMIVTHKGDIMWLAPVILKARCKINVKYFPFDTQHCNFVFGSWTFQIKKLNVFGEKIGFLNYTPSQEWKLVDSTTVRTEHAYPCCPTVLYPDVTFHIHFQRKTLFYLVNLIFPIILITMLTIMTFILPVDCGERFSVSITLMLAVMIFILLVADMIPESSDGVPIVGVFIIFCLVTIVMVIVSLSFVSRFHYRRRIDRPIGRWMRFYIFERLSYILGTRYDPQAAGGATKIQSTGDDEDNGGTEHPHSSSNAVVNDDDYAKDISTKNNRRWKSSFKVVEADSKPSPTMFTDCLNLDVATANTFQKSKEDRHEYERHVYTSEEEWKVVANTIDRLLFFFFIIFFTVGCLCCFANTLYVQ